MDACAAPADVSLTPSMDTNDVTLDPCGVSVNPCVALMDLCVGLEDPHAAQLDTLVTLVGV